MLNGALLAIEETNASHPQLVLEPVIVNPGGHLDQYVLSASDLLTSGIRHVIGCYTSSSRKEVIPCFEKHDGLLWYPSHYEGFESSENVIYTGAAPNQHILPLIDHLMKACGPRAFCVGSNYIWAWENNRIMREGVVARGGCVVAERYVAVGETDLDQLVRAIIDARPSFVFSSLIGTSGYEFIRRLRAVCRERQIDQATTIPVASCNLSEPELVEIGEEAVDGHLSSSVYFSSIESPANRRFVSCYASRFPEAPLTSADAEASYIAAKLLGLSLVATGTDEVDSIKAAVPGQHLIAPQGAVHVDPESFHCYLTPRIGRSQRGASFEVIMAKTSPMAPDPYLVRSTSPWATEGETLLRVIR